MRDCRAPRFYWYKLGPTTNPNPGKANDPKGSWGLAPNMFSLILNSQGHMMLKIPQKENENLWYTKEEILMQYHFWILTLHFASLQSLDKVAKKQNLVWPEDKSNHWDFTWIRLLGLWSEPEKVQNYFHLPQISSPSTNNSFSSIGVSRLSSWPEEGLTFKG